MHTEAWSGNSRHTRRFANDEDVTYAVRAQLRSQLETFFADGVRKLVDCSNMCGEARELLRKMSLFIALCVWWNKNHRPS
jgi:hypothetical protein